MSIVFQKVYTGAAALRARPRLDLIHLDFGLAGIIGTGLVFAAAVCIFLYPGRIFVGTMLNDFFLLLETAYRVAHGQVPGVHFTNPIGILSFAPQALVYRWTGDLSLAALVGQVGYAVLVLLLCWYVALTRLPLVLGAAVTVTLSLLMLSPWVLGATVFHPNAAKTTTAMFYNRLGFILVTLAALLAIAPTDRWRSSVRHADALVAAVMAGAAYYAKMPYGLAVIALVSVWFGFVERRLEVLKVFALGFVAIVLVFELLFPGLNVAYLKEQFFAADLVGAVRLGAILRAGVFTAPEVLAAALLPLAILWLTHSISRVELLYFALFLGGCLVLLTQAAQGFTLVAPLAVGTFALTRCLRGPQGERQALAACAIAIGLLTGLMMLLPPAVVNIVRHAKDASATEPIAGLPPVYGRLRVPQDVDLDLLRRSLEGAISSREAYLAARRQLPVSTIHAPFPSEYLYSLTDLVKASKLCGPLAERPAVLDFTNMAPSFLGKAPSSGFVYMHYERSFSPTKHLPYERMFGDVDCLLDPKFPIEVKAQDGIWSIYGDQLRSKFVPAGETIFWQVHARRSRS